MAGLSLAILYDLGHLHDRRRLNLNLFEVTNQMHPKVVIYLFFCIKVDNLII
jgi:hypothetical protein